MTMAKPDATHRPLIPIEDYDCPSLPADEWIKAAMTRIRATFRHDDKAFIADDRLKRATLKRLDQAVAPPACGPVMAELDAAMKQWFGQPATAERIKAIVLPPCDDNDVVGAWARDAGHRIVTCDDARDVPAALAMLDTIDDDPASLLVIPRLERWYLRRLDGLAGIRTLMAALAVRKQRTVIGCNAWTWAYLSKAAGIDMLVGTPLCFAPFDAERLREWFGELARDDMTRGVRFRRADDGSDILTADAADGKSLDFFRTLAGRSRGIPWVAWHMWRRMLRTDEGQGDGQGDDAGGGGTRRETLWVTALEELVLPGDRPRDTLLILHALLLHGEMRAADLRAVLPIVGDSVVPAALVMSGFVQRDGDRLSIRPEAYPAVRSGLETAGMSMGVL